jgi:hypothetical protein
LTLGLLACPAAGVSNPAAEADRPRLAVLVVFDQLRADYLTRWESLFGESGFHRLQRDGAWFQECYYPYANTVTGAGHASLMTGCSPNRHGIVGNEWYDAAAGRTVYCVASERYERVPAPAERPRQVGEPPNAADGVSPERLMAPTVGDVLKEATAGRARVVSLSFKDRSAVPPGGRHADGCYWLGKGAEVMTSSYYRDSLPPWAADFNRDRERDRWLGKDWTRLRPDLDYVRYSGPDDVAGEGTGSKQGRTFPHPLGAGLAKPGPVYYEALYNSPFGNDLLLDLVKRAVDGENLGVRDAPDLLCVSFSSNDSVGHCYGPDSQEVLDVTLRSDLIVRDLLAYLDAKVGKGRYVLALTADHGVCPLPEVARREGKDAGRVIPVLWPVQAELYLKTTFGKAGDSARWVKAVAPPWFHLDHEALTRQGLSIPAVEAALADWLRKQTGIQAAYTRTQLLKGIPADDAIGQAVQRSFYPARCGDVTAVLKPYYLFGLGLTGTNHGSPNAYDTHVPLLVYGPGIAGGVRREAVTPQAVAAIFCQSLAIRAPALAEAPVPASLRR